MKPATKLSLRPYQTEADFWRLRAFLRETYELHGGRFHNWHVSRLDYWRGHLLANCQDNASLADWIYLWETAAGQIAAALVAEEPGQIFPQIHPVYRTPAQDEAMIAVAEEKLAVQREEYRDLAIWVDAEDATWREMLTRRGYARGQWVESQWRRDLDAPLPDAPIPAGYTIRSLGDVDEIPARSWASWRGFHPDAPDEDYEGWEWYFNIQRSPLYRRDLDIVAIAPSGEIASFCTLWYDDATRSVCIEPVATVPEHLRRGLARAVITEGLRRARKMGAARAFVSGFGPGPNALYAGTLSPDHDRLEQWVKKW